MTTPADVINKGLRSLYRGAVDKYDGDYIAGRLAKEGYEIVHSKDMDRCPFECPICNPEEVDQ